MRTVSRDQKDPRRYDDMLDMPHHVSMNHHPMPVQERAAQFSPFSALAGYEEMIEEASRQTDQRICLSEEQLEELDEKMEILKDKVADHPEVQFTLFHEDERKEGGEKIILKGKVQKTDECRQIVLLCDHTRIPMDEIIDMQGSVFDCLQD